MKELTVEGIVTVYNCQSEVGPRALDHHSIFDDPWKKEFVRFTFNSSKKRESFQPFTVICLTELDGEWCDLREHTVARDDNNVSPYMSIAVWAKESKRALIRAIT